LKKTQEIAALTIALIIIVTNFTFAFSNNSISKTIATSGILNSQNITFNKFLIGSGAETWNNLQDLNSRFLMNMTLGTSWIGSKDDLYGWWSNYFLPSTLWSQNCVPHLITYQYFKNSWNVDYSAANLSLHKQEWLNDLTFMANHLKAPDDGHHTVLISLETEFNCYENINYTYWNQLMIESRNTIKQVAPNVLVSYCIGGWEWRFNDVSMNGALASSMRSMDFISFQAIWGAYGEEKTKWLAGDDLRTNYGAVNWVTKFGIKPHIWDYMVDDIAANVEALSMYNPHILLAHFCINDNLWGLQSQVDVVNEITERVTSLKAKGLFGMSWMNYMDVPGAADGGFLFADGSSKPCVSSWVELVNQVSS